MMYAVIGGATGSLIFWGDSLEFAENFARRNCQEGQCHLYTLKESYETITKTTVHVIKQGERLERHGK